MSVEIQIGRNVREFARVIVPDNLATEVETMIRRAITYGYDATDALLYALGTDPALQVAHFKVDHEDTPTSADVEVSNWSEETEQ